MLQIEIVDPRNGIVFKNGTEDELRRLTWRASHTADAPGADRGDGTPRLKWQGLTKTYCLSEDLETILQIWWERGYDVFGRITSSPAEEEE